MPPAMAGKKRDLSSVENADEVCVGRGPERRVQSNLFEARQSRHLVETAAAYDTHGWICR